MKTSNSTPLTVQTKLSFGRTSTVLVDRPQPILRRLLAEFGIDFAQGVGHAIPPTKPGEFGEEDVLWFIGTLADVGGFFSQPC